MLRIRLSRVGKKGHPSYRIVVADVTAPRDGAYLEWIGNYDPMADPPLVNIKEDRATHWLNLGAQPSDPVLRILDKNGILERSPRFRTSTAAPDVPASEPTQGASAAEPQATGEDPAGVVLVEAEEPPAEEENPAAPDEEAGGDS